MKLFSVSPQSLVSEPSDRNMIQILKRDKSSKPESLVLQRHWRGSLPGLSGGNFPAHTLFCVYSYVLWICPLGSWFQACVILPLTWKIACIWMESFSHPISCLWKHRCQIPLSFCTVSVSFSTVERQGIPKTGEVCLNVPFVYCSS